MLPPRGDAAPGGLHGPNFPVRALPSLWGPFCFYSRHCFFPFHSLGSLPAYKAVYRCSRVYMLVLELEMLGGLVYLQELI